MGLFQAIADFYDYTFPYYRHYIRRRLLFREDEPILGDAFDVNKDIFSHKDYNDPGFIIIKSTKHGLFGGIVYGLGSIAKGLYLNQPKAPLIARMATTSGTGALTGFMYGTLVYAIANFRGKKDDALNHMLAASISLPMMSILAKNRFQAFATLAVLPAVLTGFLKEVAQGGLAIGNYKQIELGPGKPQIRYSDDAFHWKREFFMPKDTK